MNDDLRPALVALGAWLGFGAALDVILVHENKRPITHALRTPVGSAFLVLLCCHVADVLGPLDPFRRVAGLIPRRRYPSPDSVTNGMAFRNLDSARPNPSFSPCPQPRTVP